MFSPRNFGVRIAFEPLERLLKRLSGLVALALLSGGLSAGLSNQALAVEWQWGDVQAQLDSFMTVSASVRTQSTDCNQIGGVTAIGQSNGGCNDSSELDLDPLSTTIVDGVLNGRLINSDDGNLNVHKGDFYSVLVEASHELEVSWQNYGAFVRVLYFYDAVQVANFESYAPRRTPLSDAARWRGNLVEGGVVGVDFRLLDAYAYGMFDVLDRNFELRFGNQVINWGEEYFTQGGIKATNALDVTKLRTAGSELRNGLVPAPIIRASGDIVGPLTFEAYYQFDWHPTQIDPTGTFYSISDLIARGAEAQFTVEDPGTNGRSVEDIINTTIVPGFLTGGSPFLGVREPPSQGQWGAALRYYLEFLQTEFAFYYTRFHDKQPTVSFSGTGIAAGDVGYFIEYAEDINVYGGSFNTTIGGVAVAGELSYRPNQPLPVTDAFQRLYFFSDPRGIGESSGAVRRQKIMAIANALWVPGPGTPAIGTLLRWIGAEDMTFIGEMGVAHYPTLDPDHQYAPPNAVISTVESPIAPGEFLHVYRPDATSAGYVLRFALTYSRFLGSAVTLTPSLSWRHDISGISPDAGVQYTDGRKDIALQLTADYQNRWKGIITYSNSFGAGKANTFNDRDFAQFTISYAF